MEIIEENNCFVFKSQITNDLTIYLNDKQIKVNKEILISESDYFKAMFDNKWIENNNNCVKLEETLIKPFIIVLQFAYGLHLNNDFKVSEINESIIIANKYQFNRIEKMLSKKVIEMFPSIKRDNKTLQTVWDTFKMSEMYNLLHLSNECLNYIDENANEVIKTFDKLFISPKMLFEIISRDSFGVKEIDLFNALMSWITKTRRNLNYKFYEHEQRLFEAIRFHLISAEDMEKYVKPAISKLFSDSIIDGILNDILNGSKNKTLRVCIQPEIPFIADKCERSHSCYDLNKKSLVESESIPTFHDFEASQQFFYNINQNLSLKSCAILSYNLLFMRKINCIQFKIFIRDEIAMSYVIEVRDNQTKQWKQVIDYRDYKCNSLQELLFDEVITDSIRIICITRDSIFEMISFSCKYTKNPAKLTLLGDITAIDGTKCLLIVGLKCKSITESIFRDDSEMKIQNYLNLLMSEMFESNQQHFKTYYNIKFCQPFAIDSFQFDVKLQTNDSQLKYEAVFEVSILSNQFFDYRHPDSDTRNWVIVSEDSVKESVTCNVAFDLQTVSVIKICGFQFKTDDKQSRIPLHISGVRVPVSRTSDQWINGKDLSAYRTDVHQMLSCFH